MVPVVEGGGGLGGVVGVGAGRAARAIGHVGRGAGRRGTGTLLGHAGEAVQQTQPERRGRGKMLEEDVSGWGLMGGWEGVPVDVVVEGGGACGGGV